MAPNPTANSKIQRQALAHDLFGVFSKAGAIGLVPAIFIEQGNQNGFGLNQGLGALGYQLEYGFKIQLTIDIMGGIAEQGDFDLSIAQLLLRVLCRRDHLYIHGIRIFPMCAITHLCCPPYLDCRTLGIDMHRVPRIHSATSMPLHGGLDLWRITWFKRLNARHGWPARFPSRVDSGRHTGTAGAFPVRPNKAKKYYFLYSRKPVNFLVIGYPRLIHLLDGFLYSRRVLEIVHV